MYYKVVTNNLKSSWLSNRWLYNFAIQYKINEWVYPHPNTSLMVFNRFKFAEDFLRNTLLDPKELYYSVYTCDIIESDNKKIVNSCGSIIDKYLRLLKIDKNKADKYLEQNKFDPLDGTVFCSAVKLKEKL